MDQKAFLDSIKACRRRLNMAGFLKRLTFGLCIGACAGILFQTASFVTPFYYANVYTAAALLLAAGAAMAVSWLRRSSMKQAALVMDSFGFQERIITAYEHLEREGALHTLQRKETMEQLKRRGDRIRIPLWPGWKKTALPVVLLVVMLGLTLAPSRMKDQAGELHRIRQEAREKEKEIEEVLKELDQIEKLELEQREELEQAGMRPEDLAALQEIKEELRSSLEEYSEVSTAKALQAAGEKLNYKYENISVQMSELAQSIQNGTSVSVLPAESIQAMADKYQKMSGHANAGGDSLASAQGQSGQGAGSGSSQSGQGGGQSGQGGSQNGQGSAGSGQSGQGGSQNGQSGQGSAGSGQSGQGDGQNGQSDGQNGQSGSQNGQSGGQNGQSDSQNGQSGSQSGGQNGQGDGQNGSENGQSGSENGQGDGQNGQNSPGRGTGSANIPRDYVSIPNAVTDSGNLTGNAVDHEGSEFFRAQNGLGWAGTPMPYDAVIGSYEQNAYEGIAAGRYPSGMENVIKEYFSGFNY